MTVSEDKEAGEIAGKLTEDEIWAAQKLSRVEMSGSGNRCAYVGLVKMGLAEQVSGVSWRWKITPLGLRVASLLQASKTDKPIEAAKNA